ncbi:MAG: cobalamin-binding protein [Acidobacteria bacterium]|nr:cobalamin-binding protein [Acidobacteriota bacterium]
MRLCEKLACFCLVSRKGAKAQSSQRFSLYKIFSVFPIILALLLYTGCERPQTSAPGSAEFTDGLGRKVLIKKDPQRIISLAPNVTEILFALGLGARIEGVTTYCDFPEEAKAKAKIGDTLNPSIERIIGLKPDLVIISTASQLEKLTGQLDQLSIPVFVTNPRKVSEAVASIRLLGEVTGTATQANQLADELDRRINAVERRVKDLPKPRVLYVLQTDPLITAGRQTFINDLILLAGGNSISGDEKADYPQFSRETVVVRAPEIIIAPSSHGAEFVREKDLREQFATTPAIRFDRIVRVNPDWVDRPGPRIVLGLEQLAQGLHPEKK